jgi:hypothetical protein
MNAVIQVTCPDYTNAFVQWRKGEFVCLSESQQRAQQFPSLADAQAEACFIRVMFVRPYCPIKVEAIPIL